MLTVTQSQDGQYLLIKAHYFYTQRIKNIPSAVWNPDGKFWQINSSYAYQLENEFHDEIYYKTPFWVIFKKLKPDYTLLYNIDKSIIASPLMQPYKLYDYQEYGARFAIDRINKHGFCIIADDVGLGKTPQAISVLLDRVNNGAKKVLIICKKSIKSQWADEIDKFTDLHLTFIIEKTGDTKAKRTKAYNAISNSQNGILITNYQSFLNDEAIINSLNFDFVVIKLLH